MTFDGSPIDGFSRIQESDVLAMPRPQHVRGAAVGRPEGHRGAGLLRHPQPRRHAVRGRPAPGAAPQPDGRPRRRASRSTSPPTSSSSTSRRRRTGTAPVPLDEGGFFDLTTTDVAGTLRKQTIRTLETMSIPVEYSFHEDAPSQHEIDLRHTDALTMADSVMTFRLVVKEVAASQGVHATFMPKPLEGVQGSGMHMHLSCSTATTTRSTTTTIRTTCRRWRRASWPACCATPPRSPRSPTRRSTATSGWCPASRHRCTSAGRATTAAA